MENLVFTQLSIQEVRQLLQQELENYFSDNPIKIEKIEPEPDRYITKKEAAKLWGCSVSTIDNYRRAGILKRYRIGSAVRFKRSELLEAIEEMNKKGGKL